MKGSYWFCFTALSVAQFVNAARVISAPISRKSRDHGGAKWKRAVSETLTNEVDFYFANISIGTPPQPLSLDIDTGSSDTWVQVPNTPGCDDLTNPCVGGFYDNTSSSSYAFVSSDFNIRYGDDTIAIGDYAVETIEIGGLQIKDMQLGLGIIQNTTIGIIGVGYPENEALVTKNNTIMYPNLLDEMVSQGLIESRTYSLYLNDINNETGTIIFGGLDLEGFSGTLYTFPINPPKDGGPIAEFIITLTELTVNSPYGCSTIIGSSLSLPVNALLDSGTTTIVLPQTFADAIGAEFNATLAANGAYLLPSCDSIPSDVSLSFDFSGVKIDVPSSELVLQLPNGTCFLSVESFNDSGAILGDTFLRSAYVVFDLENDQISMAQANFNATTSDVREIPAGVNKVPSASLVSNPTVIPVL